MLSLLALEVINGSPLLFGCRASDHKGSLLRYTKSNRDWGKSACQSGRDMVEEQASDVVILQHCDVSQILPKMATLFLSFSLQKRYSFQKVKPYFVACVLRVNAGMSIVRVYRGEWIRS